MTTVIEDDTLTVLSLCAGIGGLELGLERAGMVVVGQVEINKFCRQVLAKHWPSVPKHGDITTCVDWWTNECRPRVDLICGGFPCQPISSAGKGLAQHDERWLWPHFVTIIRELRPRWVVLENVPRILNKGLSDILRDLASCRYDAEWDCIPASAVGAIHSRDRWFCVAYPSGARDKNITSRSHRSTFEIGTVAGSSNRTYGRSNAERDSEPGRSTPIMEKVLGSSVVLDEFRNSIGHWSHEPGVLRLANGVPLGVDRRHALGNAVVPQVSEYVGRCIIRYMKRRERHE